ncbi:hypothetical protein C0995_014541 [Termitomyces sp. Mi166|nr:hypothetical protein C0995_014541 [Termitomyces sp. Mi166\
MAPRRGTGAYANTLSPTDQPAAGPSSQLATSFPRSTSPSSGLAQFLAKPSKWFSRSASISSSSSSSSRTQTGPEQPRPSVSSSRKHKISRPTDPRPILESYAAGGTSSKSVLDLSARLPGSLDIPAAQPNSTPSSPSIGPAQSYNGLGLGTGDLRSISRRGWSKSADDLSQLSPSHSMGSFKDRVAEYRNRSNSSASVRAAAQIAPPSPSIGRHPFPSSSPPRSTTMPSVSISISAPMVEAPQPRSQQQQQNVHTRSYSFAPKHPSSSKSKLSVSTSASVPRLVPPSPKRKGTLPGDTIDTSAPASEREKPLPPPVTRSSTFPFSFTPQPPPKPEPQTPSSILTQQPTSPLASRQTQTPAPTFLVPPSASAPGDLNLGLRAGAGAGAGTGEGTEDSKRASQIVFHSGFVNRLADAHGQWGSHQHQYPHYYPQQQQHHAPTALSKGWKGFKLELKGSKLYFYKPPNDRSAGVKELFPTAFGDAGAAGNEDEDDAGDAGGDEEDLDWERVGGGGGGGGKRGGEGGRGVGRGRDEGQGRKKRAYWGRGTHPELVRSEGKVERGTFEALVHEAVFATTFLGAGVRREGQDEEEWGKEGESKEEQEGGGQEENQRKRTEEWKTFASAVVLGLPALVGLKRFEAEFVRCCSFVGVCDDEEDADGEGGDDEREDDEDASDSDSESDSDSCRDEMKEKERERAIAKEKEKARSKRQRERERIAWLAAEYLRYHADYAPVDPGAWESAISVPYRVHVPNGAGARGVQASMSTQGVYQPSPVLGGGGNGAGLGSPNTFVFSPRPGEGARVGMGVFGALDAQDVVIPSKNASLDLRKSEQRTGGGGRSGGGSGSRVPWAALETSGLSRAVLLSLDPQLVMRSLVLFHRSVVEKTKEDLTAGFVLGVEGLGLGGVQPSPSSDAESMSPTGNVNAAGNVGDGEAAELFGTDDNPHWLTKLVLMQVLGADTSMVQNQAQVQSHAQQQQLTLPGSGRKSEDLLRTSVPAPIPPVPTPQPSTPTSTSPSTPRPPIHSRSDVISAWARIGELCRLAGDECTFRAIVAALTARPVARLDKVWRRVDRLAVGAVEGWVYEGAAAKEPRVTVWGGDARRRAREALGRARDGEGEDAREGDGIRVIALEEVREVFEGCRRGFALCKRRGPVLGGVDVSEEVRRMVAFWKGVADEGGGTGSVATKFQRYVLLLMCVRAGLIRFFGDSVDQFMSLSLAAEPRRKGLFEPHFWTRSTGQQQQQHMSLLPLLFPEPMPTVCLIDRAQLLRGRVDSDASDTQLRRAMDPHRHPDLRTLPTDHGASNLNWGGTVIPVYNGDLLLVVQAGGPDSAPNSRPSSSRMSSRPPSSIADSFMGEKSPLGRTPSIRVKPGSSQGLERKTSVARRNSMPSITHRQNYIISEPSSEPPLRVMVQAGTLNTLVGILVHGLQNVSVSVADDNGEMSLREGMTRELLVDRVEYAKVWWNVFRSFVNPLAFFELLRKLYITPQPVGSSPPVGEYVQVLTARTQVLDTIKEWLTFGGGAQDVLDDIQLFHALQSFLDSPANHVVYEAKNFTDPVVQQCKARLTEARESLLVVFNSQTKRPLTTRGPPIPRGPAITGNSARTRTLSMREPPDIDRFDVQEFVDNLDGMACATFSNVTEEDLYITADLLEVQFADRTAWFSVRETSSMEETVDIQTIYTHIQDVDHSPLISEMAQDSLYRLLPPGIRSCVRAYAIIRKWIISKIIAPRLGPRVRQARMEFLLRVIEIARWRNSNPGPGAVHTIYQSPCVRSFVETVTTSAILSIESRLHSRAWQNIALNRAVSCESLASLLSRPSTQLAPNQEPLTPDMGWVLERLLEVIADPDTVPSVSEEGQNLVSFDKRRHLCNLIAKAPALPSLQRRYQPDELNRRGYERLNNVEREVISLQFDHRGIKDEAVREASQILVPSGRKLARPFQRIVIAQLEKNRRDKNLRSRLQKEKLQEQSRQEKRDDLLNRAMRPRKPSQKQHRNKKSMSALFHFMRPISSAFGADLQSSSSIKKTAAELDFVPSGKPSLVLSLVDARVVQFINNERPFTFQLDTEDGGHYLLQAMNRRDMIKWIETIGRVATMAAKRRLTYLGPKPQLADHIHNYIVPSRDPKAVFGVELEFLLQREAGNEPVQPGVIPFVIEQCLSEVEVRGLSEVGIYRIAGAVSEINALKEAFNREFDDLENRLEKIRNVVQGLPRANFDLLRRVAEHLDRVTDFEEQNHMTAEALAIVFSPNLLRAPQNDFSVILANMGHTHKLVKALITHFHVIFDDADAEEADFHSEEYDSPIPEEDEEDEGDETDMHLPQILETEQASSEANHFKHDTSS